MSLKKRSSVIRIFFRLRRAQNNTIKVIKTPDSVLLFLHELITQEGSDTVRESVTLFVEMNRDFSSDTKQNTLQKEREKAGPYAPFFGRHGTQVYESFLLIRNRLCE